MFAAALGGIEPERMSDIFHEWTQVLDVALQRMFQRPTCSQMLQAYPCVSLKQMDISAALCYQIRSKSSRRHHRITMSRHLFIQTRSLFAWSSF